MLDYGRQSTTPPRPVPVDLRALVEECAFEAGTLGHPVVRLQNRIEDGVTIKVDPDQFARVLTNLMKNAREALEAERTGLNGSAPSRPDARIVVAADPRGDELVISVTDTGPGLPPRARDNLFVAFEGSARAGGTGLGLAIARELTEAHGGRLNWVKHPPARALKSHCRAAPCWPDRAPSAITFRRTLGLAKPPHFL